MLKYSISLSVDLLCSKPFNTWGLKSRGLKLCSVRDKMDREPEVWKYLEESAGPNEDKVKKKERLLKAKSFRGRSKNIFVASELDTKQSEGMDVLENIPMPPPLPTSECAASTRTPPPLPPDKTTKVNVSNSNYNMQRQNYNPNLHNFPLTQNQSYTFSQSSFFSSCFSSYNQRGRNHSAASFGRGRSASSRQQPPEADRQPRESSSQISSSSSQQISHFSSSSESSCDFALSSSPLYEARKWSTVSKEKARNGTKIRLLSYNVLAQDLLESNTFLYRDLDPTWLPWKQRWKFIMWEVLHFDPDIVTLQEIQFKRPNYFKTHYLPFFEDNGYRAIFKCRTGEKNDGCAIFYKNKIFKLDEYSKVEYYKPGDSILNRENIGLVARLVERDKKKSSLIVGTTHLLFNKKRVDVRLAQAALFLAEVDKLREKNGLYSPVIMTGDFNSNSSSPVYELMSTGNIEYEGLSAGRRVLTNHLLCPNLGVTDNCQYTDVLRSRGNGSEVCSGSLRGFLSHSLNLESVYGDLETDHVRDPVVSTNHGDWTIVDYIFYSRAVTSGSNGKDGLSGQLYLKSRLMLPFASQMMDIGRIPSPLCPSDHFPLLADFLLVQNS